MWVRAGPHDDFVFCDHRIGAGLKRSGIIIGEGVKASVREAINKGLRPCRKSTLNRTNVRGFSIIVPSKNFRHLYTLTHGYELLPSRAIEPIIGSVKPVLIPRIGTEVSVEERRHSRHVYFVAKSGHVRLI